MIRALWRALKREWLLHEIVLLERKIWLLAMESGGMVQSEEEILARGELALAYARLDSEEFNPAPKSA